jgi:5-methylcytosine-specific restriction protein A
VSNAFILTWNPKVWDWPADDYLAEVAETEAGRSVRGQWSVGNRRQGIGPGDLAFLVRQNSDRGIVAVGEFVSEIFEEAHFLDSGRTAAYATVEWSSIVLPADRLPIEVLLGEVPEVPWNNLMSSGIQVPSGARERILELWNDRVEAVHFRAPDEVIEAVEFIEGAVSVVRVNRYERDPHARRVCIDHWGTSCSACGFDFERVYGEIGKGYIHVHHLRELASIRGEYQVDPVEDLRPLCPNCHAMVHQERPAMKIQDLRRRLRP